MTPEEVLPLLSHQIVLDGYGGSSRASTPTEYLILVRRYVYQARELQALAGPDGNIRVSNCDEAHRLLSVIGYRLRETCGPNATLEAGNPRRAFTAVDSGFPLADLERALQTGKPFVYPYGNTQLPVLFDAGVWMEGDRSKNHRDLLDALLGDPELARLYWALARIDEETRSALRVAQVSRSFSPSPPCWISMANNCAFEAVACRFRADPKRNPPGNIWWGSAPIHPVVSSGRSSPTITGG